MGARGEKLFELQMLHILIFGIEKETVLLVKYADVFSIYLQHAHVQTHYWQGQPFISPQINILPLLCFKVHHFNLVDVP